MRRSLGILGVLLLAVAGGQGAAVRRKTVARPSPVRTELKVAPSESIEARVEAEIRKAEAILAAMDSSNVIDSPYLISALYYRDGFLNGYDSGKSDGDPARRIIAHLGRALTAERKRALVGLLHERYGEAEARPRPAFVSPVPYKLPPKPRSPRLHPNALDLFAPEGTRILSASSGVVVLAEQGWSESDPFSTSSHAGGNTVIVFDLALGRFLRYCHFETVAVMPGQWVEPGDAIGAVGHSGLNASRPRHGGHVHFEVHLWDGGAIRPLSNREIWELFRAAAK